MEKERIDWEGPMSKYLEHAGGSMSKYLDLLFIRISLNRLVLNKLILFKRLIFVCLWWISSNLCFWHLIPAVKSSPQYKWLQNELLKVNRDETPWLIVLMHTPMYSSYVHHYMEGESMRVVFEPWFVKYKVDVVFAGHVHAYERSVS